MKDKSKEDSLKIIVLCVLILAFTVIALKL